MQRFSASQTKKNHLKKLQLILTNPCSENWDEMQPSKAGRFCDKCEKHIVDLTSKSDAELIDFFKQKKENVCGRLLPTQLNRDVVAPPQKTNWNWLLLPIAVGASVITPVKAMNPATITIQNDPVFSRPSAETQSNEIATNVVDTIKGKVTNQETGKPLEGVKVKIKGFANVVALTDHNGNFYLTTEKTKQAPILVFTLDGYGLIEKAATSQMVVQMKEIRTLILGGISAVHVSSEPLYVIYSGKKSCIASSQQKQSLNPDWIEKVDILKGAKAAALYGSRAANGVVMVEIKKKYAKKIDFSKKN